MSPLVFSTKLMRQLFTKHTITEEQLKFLLYKLPNSSITKPYDAAPITVLVVLEVSTNDKILQRMFELGMRMGDGDLTEAVEIVSLAKADTFELLIERCSASARIARINKACNRAMEVGKVGFVELLIEYGATPPADELLDVVGFTSNPVIQQYLSGTGSMDNPLYQEFMGARMGGRDWEHMHEKVCWSMRRPFVCVCVFKPRRVNFWCASKYNNNYHYVQIQFVSCT